MVLSNILQIIQVGTGCFIAILLAIFILNKMENFLEDVKNKLEELKNAIIDVHHEINALRRDIRRLIRKLHHVDSDSKWRRVATVHTNDPQGSKKTGNHTNT